MLWEQNFTALNVFVGQDRVIASKIHTDNSATLQAEVASLLP